MKRIIYISLSFILIAVLSCTGTLKTSTSEVTVVVGDSRQASIKVERSTIIKKLKGIFKGFSSGHAYAQPGYIPSWVKAIKVTVEGPQMTTIVKTVEVQGQSEVVITLEVPNGLNRHFTVDALNLYGTLLNRGEASTDLNGEPVTLMVNMAKTGLFVATTGSDANDCRTEQTPCWTINGAISKTQGNEAIYIAIGMYGYPNESFPVNLPAGTAIICDPLDHATVIDSITLAAGPGPGFIASEGVYIYGCTFHNSWPAINDNGRNITVENIYVTNGSTGSCVGVQASGNSTIINSLFDTISWAGCNTWGGVYITGGSSLIKNNTFTNISYAAIQIDGGSPKIENNTIRQNSSGISVLSGNPVINYNIISCNNMADLTSESSLAFDATNNSWDHAPPMIDSTGNCLNGIDICYYSGVSPAYYPYGPAVQGGCP